MDTATTFALIVGVVILIMMVGAAASTRSHRDKREALEVELDQHVPRGASPRLIGKNAKSALAIDLENRLTMVWHHGNSVCSRVVDREKVHSVELIADENTIGTTAASGGGVGLPVAGLLVGVGGSTSTTITKKMVKRLDLKLTLRDDAVLNFYVNLVNSEEELQYSTLREPREWLSRLQVFMAGPSCDSSAECRSLVTPLPHPPALGAPPDSTPYRSPADELRKLADLQRDGVLTKEEFDREKSRLLSSME